MCFVMFKKSFKYVWQASCLVLYRSALGRVWSTILVLEWVHMNMYDDKLSLSLKVKEFLKSSLKFKEKKRKKKFILKFSIRLSI